MESSIFCKTHMIGSAAVSTTSFDIDHTWHTCLGHMTEKSMIIQSKRGLVGTEGTSKPDFCDYYVISKEK